MNSLKKGIYLVAFVQVFLLVGMIFSNSYFVGESNKVFSGNEDDFSENVLNLVGDFFDIEEIGGVSAQQVPFYNRTEGVTIQASQNYDGETSNFDCCLKMENGAICQNVEPGSDVCAVDEIPTDCSQVAECKTGTCFDPDEGLCTTNSPKQLCEDDEGEWFDDPNANIQQCERGCCVLGEDVEFVTEQRCNYLSSLEGNQRDFRDYDSELECIALKENQETGACVLDNGGCSFGTELECLETGGNFREGLLCSNPSLNTGCERQESVSCVEGKDEIYWHDSCGNRENIYSADRDESWNDGEVLSKSESCNPDSGNINSETCGNCNNLLSSICSTSEDAGGNSVEGGDFVCRDLSCVDEEGNVRENGESWCVYDSHIGEGKDTVGSRHWKRYCEDGVVKVEPCADYRGGVCVESEVGVSQDKTITNAACVVNEAMECVDFNSEKDEDEMIRKCNEHSQCQLNEVDISSTFKFNVCAPKYPRGFDLGVNGERQETSAKLCEIANQECTVIYEKKFSGWECIQNCECETEKFGEEMNDLCTSMGDCGSYVNFDGDGTDNVVIENSEDVSWRDYVSYSNPVDGQKAEPADLEEALTKLGVNPDKLETEEDKIRESIELAGKVSGGAGLAAQGLGWAGVPMTTETVKIGSGFIPVVETSPTWLGSISAATTAFGISMLVSTVLTYAFGLQGDAATIMTVSGATAGAVLAFGALTSNSPLAFGFCFDPATCGILLLILIIIAVVLEVLEIGETKEIDVKFECLPWEPPLGGNNCEECNDDPLKPCSKYRCNSLGQSCELLNANTKNPKCVEVGNNDGSPPQIEAKDVSEGYSLREEGRNRAVLETDGGECIPEFTSVGVMLETDEYAQCKFDLVQKNNYEDMNNFLVEKNSFTINHTLSYMMPSMNSLEEYNLSGNLRERFEDADIFVRCQDTYGNYNKNEFVIDTCIKSGPDLTPPQIISTDPVDEAYLRYNKTEVPLNVYTNEPAECKYDFVDTSYEEMENEMTCKTDLESSTISGWNCNTKLSGLVKDDNEVYIKCRDQPRLSPENESERNTMAESYEYNLYRTENRLEIENIEPQGTIENGISPVSVDLEVETSGGIENGVSTCSYRFFENQNWIQLFNTNSDEHSQTFDSLMDDEYDVSVRCEDGAGNVAEESAEFTLNLDEEAPNIVRVYGSEGNINLITDEEAICYYDFNRCNFDIRNASSFSSSLSETHSAEWNENSEYHVKCEDTWGNTNPGCAMVIKPTNPIEL